MSVRGCWALIPRRKIRRSFFRWLRFSYDQTGWPHTLIRGCRAIRSVILDSCCRDWGIQNFAHTHLGSGPDRRIIPVVYNPQDRRPVGRFGTIRQLYPPRGGKPRFQNDIILRTIIEIAQRRAIIRIIKIADYPPRLRHHAMRCNRRSMNFCPSFICAMLMNSSA